MSISDENEPLSAIEKKRIYARERQRRRRLENREQVNKESREWRAKNRERANEQANRSHRKAYWADPEKWRPKMRAYGRAHYARDPKKENARSAKWRAENLELAKRVDINCQLKRSYGITLQQKADMLAAQGGCCAICGTDSPGSKKGWHIDHCHDTKKVRGVLCHHCNVAAGASKDDPVRLRAIADYLDRHRTCESQ